MKRIKFLFAFIITAALLTVTVFAANIPSQKDAVNWANSKINYRLDFDNKPDPPFSKYQCVDLIYYYYYYLCGYNVGGNACDFMWNELPAGWERIACTDGFVPQPGDIAVWKTSLQGITKEAGHVGIVVSSGSSEFVFVDQSNNGRDYCTKNSSPINHLSCVIRPNFGKTNYGFALRWDDQSYYSVEKTNAVLAKNLVMKNTNNTHVSQAGVYLYDNNGTLLKSKTENANITTGENNLNIWYNVNTSLGYTLKQGTTYKYQFMVVIDGNKFYSPLYSFTTKSDAAQPTNPSPSVTLTWEIDTTKHSIGTDTATLALKATLTGVNNTAVSKVGIYLYDKDGKQLASKSESGNLGGENYFRVWYDVKSSLGYTLSPGIKYQYKFFAVVNGKTYYSPMIAFTAKGTHAHVYDDGRITLKPTVTTTGTKVYTCTVCGHVKKEVLEVISQETHTHTYDDGRLVKATATQPAKMIYTCTICGYTETKITDSPIIENIDGMNSSSTVICDTVIKETAVVDGILDNAYRSSMQVKINPPKYAGVDTDVRATVYSLYDDDYVYVFYQVENDTTLLSADDDYIQDHPMPNNNDAVELRIGDDLEAHLPEYTGSNAAHHLFMMDAYGKRFSNYEDSMGDYVDLMKGASKIISATSYNVEIAIPVVNPFAEGDIIQFNFQIDDCQNADEQETGYIGLGKNYMTLIDFKIGGGLKSSDETSSGSGGTGMIEFLFPKESPEISVTADNATIFLRCDILETNAKDVEKIGLYLYDEDRNPIESATINVDLEPTTYVDFRFNVQNDLGVRLTPDTSYNYIFFAMSNGEPYYSPVYSFKTASSGSLDNFKNVNSFDEKIFPDIKNDAWYSANAKKAYQVGLMNGNEKGFDATADITLAQVITLAARLHSIYNYGSADFVQGAVWYEVFVNYCIENDIIEKGEYTDFNRAATRAEFVDILYSSLPSREFDKKNSVAFIPDVTPVHKNYSCILSFYQAGILAGSDSEHTFFPERSITRSETAAILTRIIDKSLRLSLNYNQEFNKGEKI